MSCSAIVETKCGRFEAARVEKTLFPRAIHCASDSFRLAPGSSISDLQFFFLPYAEELGKEIGFYKDPVSDYSRLNSELIG
jgi:hypothetical protein